MKGLETLNCEVCFLSYDLFIFDNHATHALVTKRASIKADLLFLELIRKENLQSLRMFLVCSYLNWEMSVLYANIIIPCLLHITL